MKQVTYYEMTKQIAADYGLELNQKIETPVSKFPIKNGKPKIYATCDAVIIGSDGSEHPYMLRQFPGIRNDEKLVGAKYIYVMRPKNLQDLCKEAGIELKSSPCRVCEGGGWYSNGHAYYYKETYCEV